MRAGTGFDEEDLKTEYAERQIKRRKTMIQKILLSKRNPSAHQKTPEKIQNFFVQEGNEVEELIPEEPEEKGYLCLTQHHKRKRYSRKRCWVCKSNTHLKKTCPMIRCFYCHRLGHIKANCFMKKVNWLINRVKEDYQNREKRKKKIEEENITKEEEKNRQIRIFKKRAEELKYSLDKTEKGDVFTAKWRGRTIGVYTGKGLPTPTLEKLKANKFNWELMNRLAERTAPYNVFKLYEGLNHWCSCGAIDLDTRDFVGHVKDHHNGKIMKGSQLNRPPWLDNIRYINDAVEETFCFTEMDLDEDMLNNHLT